MTPEEYDALVDMDAVHTWDCDRFRTYDYGLREGKCDCQAEAQRLALIAALRDAQDKVARLRRIIGFKHRLVADVLAHVDSLIAERDDLQRRIDAVRALHDAHGWGDTCSHCGHPAPCPTRRALDGTAP